MELPKNTYIINKPKGITSFGVVARVRKITGIKKVGHAGTLDPLATGVLVVAVGREATRQIDTIVATEKEYIADVCLGQYSSTDDEEGEKIVGDDTIQPSKKEIESHIKKFVGTIMQVPPQFSAIKIKGKPAYKSARQGKDIELAARPIEIKKISIKKYNYPHLILKIICGKGTYIRSLARDLGKSLGVGAYLADLERTRVGEFSLDDAFTVEEFQALTEKNRRDSIVNNEK